MVTLRLAAADGDVLLVAAPAQEQGVSGGRAPGTAKLPRSAKQGKAQVLALGIDTLAYGAGSRVARNGAYKLRLPAGKSALRTSIATLGEPYAASSTAAIVTRAGQRRTLPLTAERGKKPRAKNQKRRPRAVSTNVDPRDGQENPGEAYGFEKFTLASTNPEFIGLGDGVPDMLTTDLLATPGARSRSSRCAGAT